MMPLMRDQSVLRAPLYSSLLVIILIPFAIFLLNFVLIYFFGTKILEQYRVGVLFHLFGGLSISFSSAGVIWNLAEKEIIRLEDLNVFRGLIFGCVCFAVIGWEVLEYVVPIDPKYLTYSYSDTINDMCFGVIGGLVSLLFIRGPVGRIEQDDNNL